MLKLKYLAVLFLLSCSCLSSCEQGRQEEFSLPKFKKEYTREFDLLGSELEYGWVGFLCPYKNYLVVVAEDPWIGKYLHIIDKGSGKVAYSAASGGRGPGELLGTPSASMVGGECFLYDRQARITHVYDIEKILQGENGYCRSISEDEVSFPPVGVFYGVDGKVVFSNRTFAQIDSTRIVPRIILDKGGSQSAYDEYPISDVIRTWHMYNQAHLTFSPDFSKMAVAPAYGGILERFSFVGGVSLMGADRFVAPDFVIKRNNPDFRNYAIPYGLSGLTSTNEKIFAGMVAEVVSGQGTRELEFPRFPILAVFDWAGRPLMRVRNSMNIECLGYDEEEGVIYAVIRDAENSRYLGKMKI